MATPTHAELEAAEAPLIAAQEAVRQLVSLRRREAEVQRGYGCAHSNRDHWGTIRVNAEVLLKKLTSLLPLLP